MSDYFVFKYTDIVEALTESEVGEFASLIGMIDLYVLKSKRQTLHFETETFLAFTLCGRGR
jgi:hypothetical protein